MIVLDASAALDYLVGLGAHKRIAERLVTEGEGLHAPHLLDAEVANGLRRLTLIRRISSSRAREALDDLMDMRVVRYPHRPLLPRAWDLRENVTILDGLYLALAEALDVPLITADVRISRAPGHRARVEVYATE